MTYTYTYDDNGNILSVSDGTYTTSYVYDPQNQLIRENNQERGQTYTWEYDSGGNIIDQMTYDYSVDDLEYHYSTRNYTYDDVWYDVLVGFGSETYTVDAIGNRTSRTNGSYTTNYTWEHGRQLASVTNGTNTWQYKYNNDGMLIEQRNGNDVYTYVYNGTQLSQMKFVGSREEYTMHFTYDANGTPMTVTFDCVFYDEERTFDETTGAFADDVEIWHTISETYYYITNIQGDVIELLNSDGESAGYYRYDAWGDDIEMWDMEDIIYYNPLRYRGYFQDPVTGYYYLQTRFYDADVGRFINADSLMAGASESVQGHNLFAYCFNNPVNMTDESGNWPSLKTILKVAAVVVAVTAVAVAVVSTLGAAGVAAGVVSASVVKAAVVGTALGGVVAGTTNAVAQGITKGEENISLKEVAESTVIGNITGTASGAASGLMGAAANGTTALIAQKGCQVAINVTISSMAYLMTTPEPTVAGFATSFFGGVVAGTTFNAPFFRGLAISTGIEFAGYVEDFIGIFTK